MKVSKNPLPVSQCSSLCSGELLEPRCAPISHSPRQSSIPLYRAQPPIEPSRSSISQSPRNLNRLPRSQTPLPPASPERPNATSVESHVPTKSLSPCLESPRPLPPFL